MTKRNLGFSLIQMSIVLTVVAIAVAAALPGDSDSRIAREELTARRLAKIEESIRGFRASRGYLPCPAEGSAAINTAAFGTEVGTVDNSLCNGGTSLLSSGNIYAGAVPTKTLQLPDETALDGFGRRFTYAVDQRTTGSIGCTTRTTAGAPYGITVTPDSGVAPTAMLVILSHGRNGHGAWPARGGASRMDYDFTNASHPDDMENASVDDSFATSMNATFVKKIHNGTFDDIVTYSQKCK